MSASECRTDGRCQYAIENGAERDGSCPKGRCVMPTKEGKTPLSESELRILWLAAECDGKYSASYNFARSIERAHGIGT